MQLQRSRRLFRTACITGDLPTVEQLIDEHKHVDLHYFVNHCNNEDGWTCLMYACAHGHREVVQYLVETGGAIVKMRNRVRFLLLSVFILSHCFPSLCQ